MKNLSHIRCLWFWGRRLAVDAFDGVEHVLLDGGQGGVLGRGEFGSREGGAADAGGDVQRTGDLSQGHFAELFVAERLEEADDRGEEFLGGVPFFFAEAFEAQGPVGGLFGLESGLGLGLLLEEAGVEGLEAFFPIEPAGPVFDGAQVLAELVGDELEGAGGAELEEGHKGVEGARGFAGQAGEQKLRVDG